MDMELRNLIIGALIALLSVYIGTHISFNLNEPYMQKTNPDLVFWLGNGDINGVAPVLVWHIIDKNQSAYGAKMEVCAVNKGKIDSGPINISLQSPSWLKHYIGYIPNVSNQYACVPLWLRHKDCFEEGNCDESVIEHGLTEIKVMITCVACEEKTFEKSFYICIDSPEEECEKYSLNYFGETA